MKEKHTPCQTLAALLLTTFSLSAAAINNCNFDFDPFCEPLDPPPSSPPACSSPGTGQVVFYQGINYTGYCVTKDVGVYHNASQIGLLDNTISSLKIGADTQVVICQDSNHDRLCQLRSGNSADLGATSVGDNTVSSASVMRKTQFFLSESIFSGRYDARQILNSDRDFDGLQDELEGQLANAFRPVLKFDADESARRPSEPFALFQVRPVGCVGQGCTSHTIVIRWAFLFERDGGYNDSICGDSHPGDNDSAAFVMRSYDSGLSWRLVQVHVASNPTSSMPYRGKIVWPRPDISPSGIKSGWLETQFSHLRPVIYQTASKHHQYLHAGDKGDSIYSDVPFWDDCFDDNDGNGVSINLGLKSVNLPYDRWNNVGEPEVDAHPTIYFVNSIANLFAGTSCQEGLDAWSNEHFCGDSTAATNRSLWVSTPIEFRP